MLIPRFRLGRPLSLKGHPGSFQLHVCSALLQANVGRSRADRSILAHHEVTLRPEFLPPADR